MNKDQRKSVEHLETRGIYCVTKRPISKSIEKDIGNVNICKVHHHVIQ